MKRLVTKNYVVIIRTHVSFDDGRTVCLNMATDAEALSRAHERVGLPFDSTVEVTTATPGDMFFQRKAA